MEKIRLNLYTDKENAKEANDFLVSEFGEGARDTFGIPRTLNGKTYYVCSWYLDIDEASRISALIPEIILVADNFDEFGYLD